MNKSLTFKIKSFIAILVLVILASCGSDDKVINNPDPPEPVDTSNFHFPFTDGTSWNYTLTVTAENIRPDSILYYFNSYPLTGYGYSEILYDTIIQLGGTVKVIYDVLVLGNDTAASRYYYSQDTLYSMVCYGFRGGLSPAFPFRKPGCNNNYGMFSIPFFNSAAGDTFNIISPPVIVLKYPVVKNTQWQLFDFGTFNISKKYVSWENYHLDTAVIPCIKTQRIFSNNSDFIYYDYYSKFGQMKRDYLYRNKPFTVNGITKGYYDERNLYSVTSFNLAAKK